MVEESVHLANPKDKILVMKLSGSLFFSDEFKKVVLMLRDVISRKRDVKLVIVAGGGPNARNYIQVARELGADQTTMDEIGIEVSRLNAMVLATALGDIAFKSAPSTLSKLVKAMDASGPSKRIIVMGGLHPGQSTNAVGALVSEKLRAEAFVNATDVDGVYNRDPRKHHGAKRLDVVTPKKLSKILERESMQAGAYDLMDPVALKLIQRSKIQTWITKSDASTLRDFIAGKKKGTQIVFRE